MGQRPQKFSKRYIAVMLLVSLFLSLGFSLFVLRYLFKNEPVQEVVNQNYYSPTTSVQKLIIRGTIPYWDQKNAFASFKENVDSFDYISLFWYGLDAEGGIRPFKATKEDETIISFAHENDVSVLAIIANLPDYDEEDTTWDADRVDKIIGSQEARQAHIAAIVDFLSRKNFDGVNIDYEALKTSQRDNFTLFIKELSEALHGQNKLVAVALHPKTGEGKKSESNGSQAQDWTELARYADQLHLMTYEQHNTGTDAGPTASNEWVADVVSYALNKIPREKLLLGIPLYAYEWSEDGEDSRGLTYAQVEEIISENDPEIQWDSESGEHYFFYSKDDQEFKVWFNDLDSIQEKLQMAESHRLNGVTFWRLGGEDERVWEEK